MIMSGDLLAGSRDRYPLHSMTEPGEQTKTAGSAGGDPKAGQLRPRHNGMICVRHEAHCYIARIAGMDWRRCLWI
jgi:hypothetical protein